MKKNCKTEISGYGGIFYFFTCASLIVVFKKYTLISLKFKIYKEDNHYNSNGNMIGPDLVNIEEVCLNFCYGYDL